MDLLTNLNELSDERLAEYATEVREAFDKIANADAPTADEVAEAEGLAEHIDAIAVERTARETAAAELISRREALKKRFDEDQKDAAEAEAEGTDDAKDEDIVDAEIVEPEAEVVDAEPVPVAAKSTVAAVAKRTARPPAPAVATKRPVTITAAADVPDFATGSDLGDDLTQVGKAMVNRMKGFGTPSGDGQTEDLRHVGVAQFHLDFPEELTIDRHSDDMEILTYASQEQRLPGDSLVAAGGWCAPSETIYDLCGGETLDGILSVPEVNASRGGIKYTSGPDFSAIYSAVGFCQTEAQAISGTAKTCYEVPCPPFVEVRLDVCGLCIKAPILTQAAYPELVQRWLSGAMIAHQHKINAKVLAALTTAAGAAKTVTGLGTTAGDTLGSLEMLADGLRSKYRLGMNQTLEVVVPFWVKGAIRSDLSNRMGVAPEVVTDQVITAHFAARHLSVTFVYDWQDTFPAGTLPAQAYPTTFQALMYPAGSFVKLTNDVINLNAVYDAASLATNVYTALFFEQGVAVAKMCNEAILVTLPVCNAGRTGSANLTCA